MPLGVTGFLWDVSPWHCVSVTGNVVRGHVSNLSLMHGLVCVSRSQNLAPVPGLPSLRVETFGLAPGVQEAYGEKMNCVCVHLLQSLPENGTLSGGEGQRIPRHIVARQYWGGTEPQSELEGGWASAQGLRGGPHI